MARVSVTLVAGITLFALMFQALSRQADTTAAATNSSAFNGTVAIATDLFGVAGGSFPLVGVVAVVAGILGTVKLLT